MGLRLCKSDRKAEVGTAAPTRRDAAALPGDVWRILATEFGERFSYYGLRAVLTLYFVSIGFSEAGAVSLFAYTSALAYFMPLLGGIVADVFWGRYWTIFVFMLVYILGSLLLASTASMGGGAVGASVALLLISIGTGGIKPCVSAFGADQLQDESQDEQRARYFSSFYMAINAGSMLSFLITPLLRAKFGFGAAFGAATIVLIVALFVFVSGQKSYRLSPPAGSFFGTLLSRAKDWMCGAQYTELESKPVAPSKIGTGDDRQVEAMEYGSSPRAEGSGDRTSMREVKAAMRKLAPVLMLMPCFWALFDQQGSAWVLQAQAMRLDGVLPFGWQITPESIQILNPIFVMMLVPGTTRLFESWPSIFGTPAPGPLTKMGAGMIVASMAFACSGAVQAVMDTSAAASVPVLAQIPQYFLITLAEVLVSVVSLDYFYAQAPAELKTAVSALALLTVSIGDILCGILYTVLAPYLQARQMLMTFAGLMLVNATALLLLAHGRIKV